MDLKGLTEGRIVHYVLPDGLNRGECRPAIVVRRPSGVPAVIPGTVNVIAFLDGANDGVVGLGASPTTWATAPPQPLEQEMPIMGTWHWPQGCPHHATGNARQPETVGGGVSSER